MPRVFTHYFLLLFFNRAGGPIGQKLQDIAFVPAPPLSIRLQQELVETSTTTSDGAPKKKSYLEQVLFALSCTMNDQGVMLVPLEIHTRLDTPASSKSSDCTLSTSLLHFLLTRNL